MKRLFPILLVVVACNVAWADPRVEVHVTDYMDAQNQQIAPLGPAPGTTADLFASPGEFEPFSFVVNAKDKLTDVNVAVSELRGPNGVIHPESLSIQFVDPDRGGGLLRDIPGPWTMEAETKRLFWVTLEVPGEAAPGQYRGQLHVSVERTTVATIDVSLDVLPIALEEPPFMIGLSYSRFDRNPARLQSHLRDMREHGMTTVAPLHGFHLPGFDENTTDLSAFLKAYSGVLGITLLYVAADLEFHKLSHIVREPQVQRDSQMHCLFL